MRLYHVTLDDPDMDRAFELTVPARSEEGARRLMARWALLRQGAIPATAWYSRRTGEYRTIRPDLRWRIRHARSRDIVEMEAQWAVVR